MRNKEKNLTIVIAVFVLSFIALFFPRQGSAIIQTDVESLTYCEVTYKGEVVLTCSGVGKCETTYLGVTLTCDGEKK